MRVDFLCVVLLGISWLCLYLNGVGWFFFGMVDSWFVQLLLFQMRSHLPLANGFYDRAKLASKIKKIICSLHEYTNIMLVSGCRRYFISFGKFYFFCCAVSLSSCVLSSSLIRAISLAVCARALINNDCSVALSLLAFICAN